MAQAVDNVVYDFIIVGSGPSGAVVASRLASSPMAPRVLLLEAGKETMDENGLVLADRYYNFVTFPEYNWGYKTAPQQCLNGRQIDYSRGRGLGGSSRINFACYTTGPKGDYDHWAEVVGDDFFNWINSRRRYDSIESLDMNVKLDYRKYVDPKRTDHGTSGPLSVSYPSIMEKGITEVIDAMNESGIKILSDINSGDPIGYSVCPSTAKNGIRVTAASAFLKKPPSNLTIVSESVVTKILIKEKRVIGVISAGIVYTASKEVIVSAGALDTPKLLLLSGIGPESELSKHDIECLHHLPGVGQNLQDHWWIPLTLQVKTGWDDRPSVLNDTQALADARCQFEKDGTGPLSTLYSAANIGWMRPTKQLQRRQEYGDLPSQVKQHLNHPTVPTWELFTNSPTLSPLENPAHHYLTFIVIGMVPQSRGTVTLASSNPSDAPISDPNLLSDEFDCQNLFEATRVAWKLLNSAPLAKHSLGAFASPKTFSDEDIMTYAKDTAGSAWHMSCTAKMGNKDDEMSVVDTMFRVRGLKGLRLADMSVAPFLPNCHTVAVAYQIGAMCAERLVQEYGLAK